MSQHKGKIITALVLLFVVFYAIAVYWSIEPSRFDVVQNAKQQAQQRSEKLVTGYVTTSTLITVADTLLTKSGGYLSNDVLPPSVIMDNMPAWEYGALEMVRDLALSMRKDFSRSQSQSTEHEALKKAQPQFNISSEAWAWPSAEGEYQKGIDYLMVYRSQIANQHERDSQFYSRADNLRSWLKEAEKRLGSLSQRLSASVGQDKVNTDLAGNSSNTQATYTPLQQQIKTSWWEIDDVFYESRGATWALLHFLQAVEYDFADVLDKKNARVSLQQIIRELEATQETVWSPMILNGNGFGYVANHSLVMANYISRANAALIELSELLAQG
ncbi:MAG: hypothetical protein ACI9H9_002579 [Pseudoalteromonas tetraodonis]|jgi:hypothetical protein|uniref:DUF2333 domain-containing protein n=7 Tax=Pseudoalteromonas TaxID=53246 RepID=A0A9W4R2N5_PSEHA|nr:MULTISPECIES: DUF2333 family protein [Pseudoalteromonas]MAY59554.1 DUF2333 domain-containing protein [Pseudoalteromonas sp.]ADT67344.1 hypothetical protein PSM_A0390 [Pseudoalteromonas sp. SM9913]ALQ53731.1 hypothetical protein PI2015_0403 [Pseudoalteromonas issachenkonii]ATC89489.1 hypothetical protein PISS_a0444 [Pseudoalteromonas issachenkonii]ATD01982.1 hypothetical protein PTET_a0412 [Pseudoalteromonas tetraodonis]|tara:strand:+ start:3372 stop:4358 length:987 start_codon:yes stop_codon:yes gene_type:complete